MNNLHQQLSKILNLIKLFDGLISQKVWLIVSCCLVSLLISPSVYALDIINGTLPPAPTYTPSPPATPYPTFAPIAPPPPTTNFTSMTATDSATLSSTDLLSNTLNNTESLSISPTLSENCSSTLSNTITNQSNTSTPAPSLAPTPAPETASQSLRDGAYAVMTVAGIGMLTSTAYPAIFALHGLGFGLATASLWQTEEWQQGLVIAGGVCTGIAWIGALAGCCLRPKDGGIGDPSNNSLLPETPRQKSNPLSPWTPYGTLMRDYQPALKTAFDNSANDEQKMAMQGILDVLNAYYSSNAININAVKNEQNVRNIWLPMILKGVSDRIKLKVQQAIAEVLYDKNNKELYRPLANLIIRILQDSINGVHANQALSFDE